MALHADNLREQYATLLATYNSSFPGIQPPEASWWRAWLDQYGFTLTRDAILMLATHDMKAHFTQASTGRGISALLREAALRQAIPDAPKYGGGHE
jgi:hypothetical protein